MSGLEEEFVADAFASNWIAPLGPHVDAFEREFAERVGTRYAAALSSGTAAIHLALQLAGVGRDDEVLVSSLTFSASVNPILYLGGRPVFIDSERASWNLDPALLAEELRRRARAGRLPRAVMAVHLYGQSADLDPIVDACREHGVVLIEDAAEALGATYRGRAPGTLGKSGIFSFNGNKVITTSGGGMLVSDDGALVAHARKLATQAREPAPHYEHAEIGYNYRLSNLLAAVGRGQLRVLDDRVAARRANFDFYREAFADLPLAHLPHHRSAGLRRGPRGGAARHGGGEHRGAPGVEADAPAAHLQRLRQRGRLRGRGPVRARPLPPLRLQPDPGGARAGGGGVPRSRARLRSR
jgi:pyridoxal phosphate-dependent aminotransferase EpsN